METLTIALFNELTGQETRHPLVTLADLSGDRLPEDLRMPCDFHALICPNGTGASRSALRLTSPGETFEIPASEHRRVRGYIGVLFHPDLLCDTPLEHVIDSYPTRCRCRGPLSERERRTIADCLHKIDKELYHAIDRYSSTILVSHIELLLNYCTRFCTTETQS